MKFSLLDVIGIKHDLEDLLGRSVDVGTTTELTRPRMKRRVEADTVEAF